MHRGNKGQIIGVFVYVFAFVFSFDFDCAFFALIECAFFNYASR